MNLKDLIEERYSVRNYLPQPIEEEKIKYILECARLAPSACNRQPWHFYVVSDASLKTQIQAAYNREWLKNAPVYIVVCKDINESWKRAKDGMDSADIDAAIAAEHICLAASAVGLGTCWICNFDSEMLSTALECTTQLVPVAIFPIAYIDKEKSNIPEKKRKPLSEITTWR